MAILLSSDSLVEEYRDQYPELELCWLKTIIHAQLILIKDSENLFSGGYDDDDGVCAPQSLRTKLLKLR